MLRYWVVMAGSSSSIVVIGVTDVALPSVSDWAPMGNTMGNSPPAVPGTTGADGALTVNNVSVSAGPASGVVSGVVPAGCGDLGLPI